MYSFEGYTYTPTFYVPVVSDHCLSSFLFLFNKNADTIAPFLETRLDRDGRGGMEGLCDTFYPYFSFLSFVSLNTACYVLSPCYSARSSMFAPDERTPWNKG